MKKQEKKYIGIEEVKKISKFYETPKTSNKKTALRMKVLVKNLEQYLKDISCGRRQLEENAKQEFLSMVQNFIIGCHQTNYPLSANFVRTYKKVRLQTKKQAYTQNKMQATNISAVHQEHIEPKVKPTFWNKLKQQFRAPQKVVMQAVKYVAATGLALLTSGHGAGISSMQDKKEVLQTHVNKEKNQQKNNYARTYAQLSAKTLEVDSQTQKVQNEKKYEVLVQDLIAQFSENISALQNAKINRRQFYKEQEQLLQKYGKTPYITPQSSCESMSYATFLRVLEKHSAQDDYVAKACKELLLQVPNPHACQSNKTTFENRYSSNLRRDLEKELSQNPHGVYLLWIKTKKGTLHRMTVIGAGNNQAYLMAYNNNRNIKMDISKLDKLSSQNGYYSDFGNMIKMRAQKISEVEIENRKKRIMSNYYALVMKQPTMQRY